MTQEEYIKKYTEPQVFTPLNSYNRKEDKRLLIPFISGDKVGFTNSMGQIVVRPKYSMCFGDCYSKDDYVLVSRPFILPKSEGVLEDHIYNSYGLINCMGEEILPVEYRRIIPAIGNKELFSIQSKELKHGVISLHRNTAYSPKLYKRIIIPFGKYEWISGFCNGFARVKITTNSKGSLFSNAKWGLINEVGELVAVCDYIFPFYNQGNEHPIKARNGEHDIIIKLNTFGEGLFGYAKVVFVSEHSGRCSYRHCFCNLMGEEIFTLPFGWIITSGFKDGYAMVESGVREGKVDKKGNIIRTGTKPFEITDDSEDYDLINDGLDGEVEALGNID